MFSCLANFGLPHKVFIYSIRTRPNSDSKSFITLSDVLGFSGIMKLDSRTFHHSNSYRKLCSGLKRYTFLTVAFFLLAGDIPLIVCVSDWRMWLFSPGKFNSWINDVTFCREHFSYYIPQAKLFICEEKPLTLRWLLKSSIHGRKLYILTQGSIHV